MSEQKRLMTRKQALAVVARGTDAAFSLSLHADSERDTERWNLYGEMLQAISVLAPVVHGKVPDECFSSLCHSCYLDYVSWITDETYYYDDLCQSCRQAKQQGHSSSESEVLRGSEVNR